MSSLSGDRVCTLASLAAGAEVVAKSESEVQVGATEGDKVARPVVLPTNDSSPNLLRIRHTCAHVTAMVVQKLYPGAQVTIGPWIEKGFFYDFDVKDPFTEKDLKKIKKEMDRIISRNLPLRREEVSREEAKLRITEINEPYKLEILDSIKSEPVTIYHIGRQSQIPAPRALQYSNWTAIPRTAMLGILLVGPPSMRIKKWLMCNSALCPYKTNKNQI